MQKTLGGDRLGSGKKMKVNLHGYERSTHDMGYLWRSTMASGTLVPFLVEVALPGDTFDINLDCDVKTHPTIGPLFGSYKVQLDIFQAPMRLYQGALHNNKLGIGLNMSQITLPQITLEVDSEVINLTNFAQFPDPDNVQINSSCILSYLGIRGIGLPIDDTGTSTRDFNGIPLLAYWDIYKNYYANKQEELGYVIHKIIEGFAGTINTVTVNADNIPQAPTLGLEIVNTQTTTVTIGYIGGTDPWQVLVFNTDKGQFAAIDVMRNMTDTGSVVTFTWNLTVTGPVSIYNWDVVNNNVISSPTPVPFALENIDLMREEILRSTGTPFNVTLQSLTNNIQPYAMLFNLTDNIPYQETQEGLGIKTYQSDLFNNWLSTEWIDGVGGINEITAIDTSGGSFNIDTLVISKKVYDMLNRIAVSGGSYDDWLDVNWDHPRFLRAETPIYHGGLIRELVFQEVVSNSQSNSDTGQEQPLGTLAGKGIMASKRKGGNVTIKVDEPSYIMGIISLTPRIDYSQGNKWDVHLKTMDDLHKPALDEIGFQELIMEQMAWWSTYQASGQAPATWTQRSAGKQPAWINYMTNVNQTRGNFAISTNEMFMTLNRRYDFGVGGINDMTTYIDPSKFNHIFAQTSIDAQNFWTQIAIDITARRKMSAKIMPNL